MVWYLMISYDSIAWYCMLLRCWLRRAGCVSQDAYILHNFLMNLPKFSEFLDALQKVGRTLGGAANEERIPEEENQVIINMKYIGVLRDTARATKPTS